MNFKTDALRGRVVSICAALLVSSNAVFGAGDIFKGYVVIDRGSGNEFLNLSGGVGTNFDGLNLGTFTATSTLKLNGYEVNTFKNGGTDITGAFGNYRVYQGSPSGSFIENNVPFNADLGGGDQRWQSTGQNTNLLLVNSTLSRDAGTYGMQVYLRASSNEGDFFMSNSGNNFTASFTVNATDYIWNGGAGTGATGTATNWSGGVTPGNGHNLHFAGSTQTSVTSAFSSINAIFFDSGASSFTIGGSAFTLGNGTGIGGNTAVATGSNRGVANNSSNLQTINNNITFGTTAGTEVTFNANTAALVLNGTINNNGRRMTVTGANNTTVNGIISGSGDLLKQGAGTLTLSGTNTFNAGTGGVTISGGTLSVAADANLGNTANTVVLNDTATFNNTASLTNSNRIFTVTNASNATVTFNTGSSTTLSFNSSGTRGIGGGSSTATLVKAGTGTLNINNSTQSLTGNWRIDAGTLSTATDSALGTGTLTLNGGTFSWTGTGDDAVPATRTITLNNVAGNTLNISSVTGSVTLANTNQLTGSGALTLSGNGTLILNASQNFSGALSVGASNTLSIGNDGALGTSAVTFGNGSTFRSSDASARTVSNVWSPASGSSNLIFGTATTGDLSLTDTTSFSFVTSDKTFTVNNANTTLAKVFTSSAGSSGGGLVKAGNGTLILTGANTYTGKTSITGGTLSISSIQNAGSSTASSLGTPTSGANSTIDLAGTLRYTGSSAGSSNRVINLTGAAGGAGTLDASGSATFALSGNVTSAASSGTTALTLTGSTTGSESGVIANGTGTNVTTVTKTGGGTWALSGSSANTYTGLTTITAGELDLNKTAGVNAIAGDGSTATNDVSVTGGTLKLLANEQIGNGATVTLGGGTFDLNGKTETLGSFINNGGTFVTGTGTFIGTTASINWAAGTNTINSGGTVTDGHITISGASTVVEVQGGGTLNLLSGGVGLVFNNATLTLDSSNGIAGKLVLNGDVTTTASSGASSIVSAPGGSNPGFIDLSTGTQNFYVNSGSTLTVGAQLTNGGITKGSSASPSNDGLGTLTLSGANTYGGGTTLNTGTLQLGGSSTGSVTNGPVGTGTLTLNGGTLSSDSTTARSIANSIVFGGDVTLGNGTNSGLLTFSGTGTLNGNRTLTFNSDVTYSGNIGESGGARSLTKNGGGTLKLSGVNTYSGGTTINAGLVQTNSTTALGSSSGSLTVNGGILDLSGNNITVGNLTGTGGTIWNNLGPGNAVTLTIGNGNTGGGNYQGVIKDNNGASAGTVAVTKTGTGTITLSGANAYTGATTINSGGTLFINGNQSLATGTVSVTGSGSTLGGSGTIGGSVTVNSGSPSNNNLSPGASGVGSVATLSTGAVTLHAATNLNIDITGAGGNTNAGITYDLLAVTGTVTVGALGDQSNLVLASAGLTQANVGQAFFIVSNDLTDPVSGTFAQGSTVTSGSNVFTIDYLADIATGSLAGGNDIALVLTAVPEPSTWIGGALALLTVAYSQRRRLRVRRSLGGGGSILRKR